MSNQNIQQNACGIQFSTHVQTSRNTKKRISFESVVAWCVRIVTRSSIRIKVVWLEQLTCSDTHLKHTAMRLSSDTVFLEVSSTPNRVRESSYPARVIQNWYTFCFTRLLGPWNLFKRPKSFPRVHTVTMFQAERATPTEFRDSEGYDLIGACCALERTADNSWQ